MYTEAGTQYKIAKDFELAADCYLEARKIYQEKAKDRTRFINCYVEAAQCLKEINPESAVKYYQQAAHAQMSNNRFSQAAKYFQEVAKIQDTQLFDRDGAIESYQNAFDAYKNANSLTTAHGCLSSVAELLSNAKQYMRAIEMFEKIASYYADENNAMQHQVTANLYKALLCAFVQEVIEQQKAETSYTRSQLDLYNSTYPSFYGTDESNFIDELLIAYNECNLEAFQKSLGKRRYKLDQWTIDMLLPIKRILDGKEGPTNNNNLAQEFGIGNSTNEEEVYDALADLQ